MYLDGDCGICSGAGRRLRRLDRLGRLRLVDLNADPGPFERAALLRALHAVSPDGSVSRGYDALVRVAGELPALRRLVPLLASPPARALGRPLYRLVARFRPRRS